MVRERVVDGRQFHFEWQETKAVGNMRKHGVPFDLARTVFNDPRLLTVADLEHSDIEDRWFSIGFAGNGAMLSVVYLWSDVGGATTKIRLISLARRRRTKYGNIRKAYEQPNAR